MDRKNFKLLVMAGHGRNVDGSWDPGATGCGYEEATLTRELSGLVKGAADRAGIRCDVAPDRNHYSFFKHGMQYEERGYDYCLEIHFNASGSGVKSEVPDRVMKGSMCYIDQADPGSDVARWILRNLYRTGSRQAWDGVVVTQRQYTSGLMVQNAIINQKVAESHIVLEVCFVTDADDLAWYQANKVKIANAIVQGIMTGFGIITDPGNLRYCGTGIATGTARDAMNVRTGPHIGNPMVGIVYTGQKVEVLEMLPSGWMKIVWPGAEEGYAYSSNVCGKYYDVKYH